jgi:hypothetical protein
MEPTEIDAFCKKILKNKAFDYIDEQLDEVSRNDLYDLANKILDTHFRFKSYALAMPSSWSCEPTDSVVILSYDSIACA